jgi:uncharacterized protein YajQ (UPF0234 family)
MFKRSQTAFGMRTDDRLLLDGSQSLELVNHLAEAPGAVARRAAGSCLRGADGAAMSRCRGASVPSALVGSPRQLSRLGGPAPLPDPAMADTFSFDVVSDFDRQELVNAVDQVRREVGQRYDLKDSGTTIDLEEGALTIVTASDMTLEAVVDVLRQKATKRNLSLKIFDFQTPEPVGGNKVKQEVKLRKGLSQELAKKLSKTVRDSLKKVTVAIQGESLRVTGKNKDDLQQAIQLLREQDLEVPLQFENYR